MKVTYTNGKFCKDGIPFIEEDQELVLYRCAQKETGFSYDIEVDRWKPTEGASYEIDGGAELKESWFSTNPSTLKPDKYYFFIPKSEEPPKEETQGKDMEFINRFKDLVFERYENKMVLSDFIKHWNESAECGGDKFNDDIESFIEKRSASEKEETQEELADAVWNHFVNWQLNEELTKEETIQSIIREFHITRIDNKQK